MEDFFEEQLERVNSWLTFAEAKNAAIIAFNIAALAILKDWYTDYKIPCTIIIVLFISSLIISIYSFFPNLSNKANDISFIGTNNVNIGNLIYYADIANIKRAEDLIENVKQKYFISISVDESQDAIIKDFAEEILINSKITVRKYKLFKCALVMDIVTLALVIIFIIVA